MRKHWSSGGYDPHWNTCHFFSFAMRRPFKGKETVFLKTSPAEKIPQTVYRNQFMYAWFVFISRKSSKFQVDEPLRLTSVLIIFITNDSVGLIKKHEVTIQNVHSMISIQRFIPRAWTASIFDLINKWRCTQSNVRSQLHVLSLVLAVVGHAALRARRQLVLGTRDVPKSCVNIGARGVIG